MARLVAFVYLLSALGAGWWIARWYFVEHRGWLNRVAASWVLITFLLLFVPSPPVFFLLVAGVLWILRPKSALPAVAYYLALLPAVPETGIGWVVPFPGLQSLYTLRFADLLSLVVLLPIVFSKPSHIVRENSHDKLVKKVLVIALTFVALTSLLDFRLTTPTNGMRVALSHVLNEALIILALAKVVLIPGALSMLGRGVLVSCVFMLLVGFAQVVTGWFIYSEIPAGLRLWVLRYDLVMMYRDGVLRIFGTQGPIPHGIFMVLGMAFCSHFYFENRDAEKPKAFVLLLSCYAALGIALFHTASRGAYLMALIALLVAVLFMPRFKTSRRVFFIPVLLMGSLAMLLSGYFMELLMADEHGTFMYRWELILNSMDSISRNFLLGTPDFAANAMLQRSRQGEGIIDIVNAYLGVILRYGSLGLLLYVMPLWISTRALLRSRRKHEMAMSYHAERRMRVVLTVLIGFAVAIFTVSLVGVLSQYYWVLIFLALAAIASEDSEESQSYDQSKYGGPIKGKDARIGRPQGRPVRNGLGVRIG